MSQSNCSECAPDALLREVRKKSVNPWEQYTDSACAYHPVTANIFDHMTEHVGLANAIDLVEFALLWRDSDDDSNMRFKIAGVKNC